MNEVIGYLLGVVEVDVEVEAASRNICRGTPSGPIKGVLKPQQCPIDGRHYTTNARRVQSIGGGAHVHPVCSTVVAHLALLDKTRSPASGVDVVNIGLA